MAQSEIDAIRALLSAKPRPVRWASRRERIDEVCSVWPPADDVKLTTVDAGGVPGEWSIVPGADASRVLLFFHGGGYCSGSIRSHRRMVTEAARAAGIRALAIAYRLAPEHLSRRRSTMRSRPGDFCAGRASPQRTSRSAATARAAV